jgi:hypothetical protein
MARAVEVSLVPPLGILYRHSQLTPVPSDAAALQENIAQSNIKRIAIAPKATIALMQPWCKAFYVPRAPFANLEKACTKTVKQGFTILKMAHPSRQIAVNVKVVIIVDRIQGKPK